MDTSVIDLPAPVAARLRRPGWRDPRLLAGIAMVAASVLLGSWVVRTAQATVPVYVSRAALVPGDRLAADQLAVVDVRLGTVDLDHYLRADRPLDDAVVVRVVGRGELVPASAVGDAADLDLRPVSVTLQRSPSKDVTEGAQVDLWFTPAPDAQDEATAAPHALATGLTVAEVTAQDGAFSVNGGAQVQVLVPSTELPDILAALAADGTVDVVPVPGSGADVPVGVLCAVHGSAESIIVQAVERSGGRLSVTRRCADLTELLAAAEAGLGRLAVVSGDLDLLDREAVELLHRAGVRVVGIGDATRPWLGERLSALGADLVVLAPQDEAEGGSVVRDALAVLDSTEPTEPVPDEVPVHRPAAGLVIAVWGPTGAPGRTTVAVNVAAELAAAGRRTLLVDADTYGGCVAQVVGMLDEAPGLAAAARAAGQGSLDLMTLARLTPQISPDLRVLSGISRADRWPELPSSSLDAVWTVARSLVEWTVIDCGFNLEQDELLSYDTRAPRRNAATLSALEAADVVLAVGSGDPVGIQRLVRGLSELTDLGLGGTRLVLVNRVRASVAGAHPGEAVQQALARYAGVAEVLLVPDDRPALDTALLQARTLREVAPGSLARRALTDVALRVDALLAPGRTASAPA